MKQKLTEREKLHREQEPRITELRGKSMVIPRPADIDAVVRRVRRGKLTTPRAIRERIARDYGTETTCQLCTGIFLNIAARAAEEDRAEGRRRITPWWRVVRDNGALSEKSPGAWDQQARMLKTEGHRLEKKGKVPRVSDFERALQKL